MNQHQARQHALSFIDQLRRLEDGDPSALDALAGLFADNAQLRNPIVDHGGRAQIAAFWRSYRATFGTVQSTFSTSPPPTTARDCSGARSAAVRTASRSTTKARRCSSSTRTEK